MKQFTFAGCQIPVTDNKAQNLETAEAFVKQAVQQYQPNVVALPECWNCPYDHKFFPPFSEELVNLGNNCEKHQTKDIYF